MKKTLLSFSLLVIFGLFYNVALADDKIMPTTPSTIAAPKPIPQYTIKITSPKPDETFQNSAQSITITVAVTPELKPEDKVVAFVDGNAVDEPIHSTSIALPWLERGSHTLQAKIIQPKGRGAATDVITIFQQRTSKLLPRR
ncbi:MAG TPA: hypothetical protein VNK03_04535 [Gammaproteobacteria bacterium]|nr:hypothetical protein [Gammaproteobacteria bacterium]